MSQVAKNMQDESRWYALYTRSRHEKFVESQLNRKGIETFTPKITLRRRWSDRIKRVEEPLFKSYCFARFRLKDKKNVLAQQGVVNVVNFSGRYVPVPDNTIESIRVMVRNELSIDPCPYVKKGDRIVIRKGPFKGLEGYVTEKRDSNMTLVVSVDAIAASVKCVVDFDLVDQAY
jgi:transcription termination/antitermination protein NusG